MKFWKGVLVGSVLISGCGSDPSNVPDAGVDGSVDAPVTLRTVSGVLNLRYVTTSGEVVVPANLSGATVSVLARPAFTVYPGLTKSDGTFSIPGVPEGTYLLKLGAGYLELSADSVDLSYDVLGRPDVSYATTPTNLNFDVANLAPWQSTDELQMFSPGSGTIDFAMQANATAGAPTAGATDLAGFVFDLSRADGRALINGSAGDELTVTQLATQTSGTRTYRTVARSFVPAPFNVTNGGTASLTGTLSEVAPTAMLDTVWDRPDFQAELAAHSPGSTTMNYSTLAVSALPEASTRGFYDLAADVVVYAPGYTTDSSAVTASWPYGDPYPAGWTRMVWIRYNKYRFIQLGAAEPVAILASLNVYRDLSTVSTQSPIVPIVGTVVSPKVNGEDAFGPLTGIGTTPTLSWNAPSIGVASRYYVTVIRVVAENGATVLKPVAYFATSATQIAIPPEILTVGNTYVFEFSVRSAASLDLSATPNAYSLPDGRARLTSGMATP